MDAVMHNDDMRRLIWSFLRSKPKVACGCCHRVLVWDKKKVFPYFHLNAKAVCYGCSNRTCNMV